MLYLAVELSLFVFGAFVLGWWFGRASSTRAASQPAVRVASVAMDDLDDMDADQVREERCAQSATG